MGTSAAVLEDLAKRVEAIDGLGAKTKAAADRKQKLEARLAEIKPRADASAATIDQARKAYDAAVVEEKRTAKAARDAESARQRARRTFQDVSSQSRTLAAEVESLQVELGIKPRGESQHLIALRESLKAAIDAKENAQARVNAGWAALGELKRRDNEQGRSYEEHRPAKLPAVSQEERTAANSMYAGADFDLKSAMSNIAKIEGEIAMEAQ
jgi:chromosome segregation ATPase